ncbi:MAG: (d)CMP kinase [Candidatus Bathyarchaeia archaeon]
MSADRSRRKKLVITVSGLHGAGRSTQAKRIAEEFDLRYISTGMVFREMANSRDLNLEDMSRLAERDDEFDTYLDARAKDESKRGDVVIDATLSAWMAEDPDIKIFLKAPFEERVRRIAERECRDIEEIREETRIRERSERKRFLRYYEIDINDLTIYDVVLNTLPYDVESTANILKKIVKEYKFNR